MAHAAGEGKYVISISFMGTGARLFDWFSNMRISREEGWHKGFFQLCRQFRDNEEKMHFDDLGKALGVKHLTLKDILDAAAEPDSPFVLWITGHSQGGAIAQIYCHELIHERGIPASRIIGCGFASPSVAGLSETPESYPIWHVNNTEDVVPRVGAEMHLGHRLFCSPDDALRRNGYGWTWTEEAAADRALLLPIVRMMNDMSSSLVIAWALIHALGTLPPEELAGMIRKEDAGRLHLPVEWLLHTAEGRISQVLRFTLRKINQSYRAIYGDDMPGLFLQSISARLKQIVHQIGAKRTVAAVYTLLLGPHSMGPTEERASGSYTVIANDYFDRLRTVGTGDVGLYTIRHVHGAKRQRMGRRYSERRVRR